MQRLVLTLLTLGCWCLCLGPLSAQQPSGSPRDASLADVTPTPTESMWLYVQEMRRYDDPRLAVRRNAEARAEQRRARIAASKWLGYSKQRPMVMPTPTTSFYGPQFFYVPATTQGYRQPLFLPSAAYGHPDPMLR